MKRLWISALIVLILDQLSKWFLTDKDFFIFRYAENYGAAFSLFQGGRWLFVLIAMILILGLFIYREKLSEKLYFPLGLLIGGALGNALDRIIYGFVRDFISIWIWPVFNLADVANVIGVVLIIWYFIRH